MIDFFSAFTGLILTDDVTDYCLTDYVFTNNFYSLMNLIFYWTPLEKNRKIFMGYPSKQPFTIIGSHCNLYARFRK